MVHFQIKQHFCLKPTLSQKLVLISTKLWKINRRNLLLRFLKQANNFKDAIQILRRFPSPFSSNMGTFNLTGRSGWIWKVAEFSNLNQSALNTSCCCINKWRIDTTYAEWMWMKSWFSVAQKQKERRIFWDWEEPNQSYFTSLLLPASSLRGVIGSSDLCTSRSNRQCSNCLSQLSDCK